MMEEGSTSSSPPQLQRQRHQQNDDNPSPPPPSYSSSLSLFHCYIPLIGSCLGILTIVIVYLLTLHYNNNNRHLPNGMISPPISLLGCQPPEHTIYQIGFAFTGLSLFWCIQKLWKQHIQPTINNALVSFLMWIGGITASIGVLGQGVITLHHDFIHNIKSGGIGMTNQDIMHQQLALLFFLGAALHTYTTCFYIIYYSNNKWWTSFSTTSQRIKIICVLISIIAFPIAELYHPTRQQNDVINNKRMINVVGLTQYIAVTSYIVFFGSYTIDLLNMYCNNRMKEQQQQQQQHKQRQNEHENGKKED